MTDSTEITVRLRPEVLEFLIALVACEMSSESYALVPMYREQILSARQSLSYAQDNYPVSAAQPDSDAIARLEDRVSALESAFAAIQKTVQGEVE